MTNPFDKNTSINQVSTIYAKSSAQEDYVQKYDTEDFNEVQNQIVTRMKNSPEVQQIADSIQVADPQAILLYGQDAAEGISRFADRILSETSKDTSQQSSAMLKELASIMKSFNPEDFKEEEPKGRFAKLFNSANKRLEKLKNKYKTMDSDIQTIQTEVKKFEVEIQKANENMAELYDLNVEYYEQLTKYIVAGEMIRDRALNEWIPELEAKATATQDARDMQTLNEAKDFASMIDQRVEDLQMAQLVSSQTAPQIKMIQNGNYQLMRKINSAFVITLPVFKIGLTEAITLQRQQIQAKSLEELDKTTNEMLVRNANNIAQNSVNIARLAGSPSIKMETLQTTFDTIMKGIEDTMVIQEENTRNRIENRKKIEQYQQQLQKKNF